MEISQFEYRLVTYQGEQSEIINPYLYCDYGCIYCYCHTDRQIAREAIQKTVACVPATSRWRAVRRLMTANTSCLYTYIGTAVDPYPSWEKTTHITRYVLETCVTEARSVIIATKSAIVLRDISLFQHCSSSLIFMSIASLNEDFHKSFEPRTPRAIQRIECVRELTNHGLPVAVFISPILRNYNDHRQSILDIVHAARDAGACLIVAALDTRPSSEGLDQESANWRVKTFGLLKDLANEAPHITDSHIMQLLGPSARHSVSFPVLSRAFGILLPELHSTSRGRDSAGLHRLKRSVS
jgi:DNA repair photolyase